MYVDGLPWHGLGTRLDRPATAKEAIQAAHLDWQVRKLPLCAVDGLLHLPVKDRFGVARAMVLWTCSAWWEGTTHPCRTVKLLPSLIPSLARTPPSITRLVLWAEGSGCGFWPKLPDSIRVVGDDITDKYLLLTNSHDGKSSLQVRFTPVRVVCPEHADLGPQPGRQRPRRPQAQSPHRHPPPLAGRRADAGHRAPSVQHLGRNVPREWCACP